MPKRKYWVAMELLGKSQEELSEFCASLGEPAYRGAQLYHALYAERAFEFARMTNLPAAFRERLEREASITLPFVHQRYPSADGSARYLFTLANERCDEIKGEDGVQVSAGPSAVHIIQPARKASRSVQVEAVYMPSEGRQTVCISTQAGCAVDCQFCLTAQLGLVRNLTAGEIVGQVLATLANGNSWNATVHRTIPTVERAMHDAAAANETRQAAAMQDRSPERPQTNVVLMGQGEPLLNFDAVMRALRILLDPKGVALSPKHVTLSTSGIVPGIERLGREPVRPKLAISLNASQDEQRDKLMPINRKYPLAMLLEACVKYPLRPWEHLTFEYVMLGGVNDAPEDARRVVRLLAPLKSVKVNLIPWNPGELPYRESSPERIEDFRRILVARGVPSFVRYSRGRDVMAACGQLALLNIETATAVPRA